MNRLEWKPIEQVFERENNKLIKIKLANNAVLEPTPEHPFYVQGKWIEAKDLEIGMQLLTSDLSELEIIQIEYISLEEPIRVYNNIQNTAPEGQEKQELINKWKSLKNQLSMAETGTGLFDVGLSTAGGVAALAGGIVALSSGTAAASTIATLSQTPQGRQLLANWFSQALVEELKAINVDPLLQSLYGEVLKAENGIQKAAELMIFNRLVLRGFFGLGLEFITSSSSLKPNTNLIGTIDESLKSFSNNERAIAEVLTKEGYNVQAIPRSSLDGTRTPDAVVHNLATDVSYKVEFKTLQFGATSNTVKDAVNKSLKGEGQARHIIIDARGSGLTQEEAVRALNRVGGITRDKLDQLRIVGDNFDLTYKYTP